MLVMERDKQVQEIKDLAARYGNGRSALLPVLTAIQRKYAHISPFAQQVIADTLSIHPVEVHSVVSFYAFFNAEPKGKFVIRLSNDLPDMMAGQARVARQFEAELGIKMGETTPDGRFTLEWTPCIGMCDMAPSLLVNDEVYTDVTPQMVHEILDKCRRRFGVYAVEQEAH
jgi:NADH:ubiquinone oxidoreductase subunit E